MDIFFPDSALQLIMNRLIGNSILSIYFFVIVSHSQSTGTENDLESARNFLLFPPASAPESRIYIKPTLLFLSSIFLVPLTLIFLVPLGLLLLVGIITQATGTALSGRRKRSARDPFDKLNHEENRLLLRYGEGRHQQSRESKQLLQAQLSSKLETYLNGFHRALEGGFFGPESFPS